MVDNTIYYTTVLLYIIMVVQLKSLLASKWNLIDEEWATELVGLRMKVRGSFWNGCTNEEKRTFYGGIIKSYNHNIRRWLIQFDNDDEDQHINTRHQVKAIAIGVSEVNPLGEIDDCSFPLHSARILTQFSAL